MTFDEAINVFVTHCQSETISSSSTSYCRFKLNKDKCLHNNGISVCIFQCPNVIWEKMVKQRKVRQIATFTGKISLNQQIHEILFSYLVELVFNAIFEALEICGLSAKVPIGMVEKWRCPACGLLESGFKTLWEMLRGRLDAPTSSILLMWAFFTWLLRTSRFAIE